VASLNAVAVFTVFARIPAFDSAHLVVAFIPAVVGVMVLLAVLLLLAFLLLTAFLLLL
jgi:hypothetical protein